MDAPPRLVPFLVIALAALFSSFATAQTTHEVKLLIEEVEGSPVPQFFFEPSGLAIEPGDTVVFIGESPHHTVTAYHPRQGKVQRVPDSVPPCSSPVVALEDSWEYTFEVPGAYDMWCAAHEPFGMAMRIVVGEATGPVAVPSSEFGHEATSGGAGQVLSDPALAVDRILSRGSVSWSEISPEAKIPPLDEMLGGGGH